MYVGWDLIDTPLHAVNIVGGGLTLSFKGSNVLSVT